MQRNIAEIICRCYGRLGLGIDLGLGSWLGFGSSVFYPWPLSRGW